MSAEGMSDHKRLFVGARISVPASNALASAVETLSRRARDAGIEIRWVPPVNYHVTLAFLGHTRVDAIAAVQDAVARAMGQSGGGPFEIETARLGAFPAIDRAHVLWAGIQERGELSALAARIVTELRPLGFAEPRPFHAHVTIGRIHKPDRKLASLKEVVLPLSEQMFGGTRIETISLFESETKSTGSVYRELHRVAFKTARNEGPEWEKRQTAEVSVGAREEAEPEIETDDGWPRGHVPN